MNTKTGTPLIPKFDLSTMPQHSTILVIGYQKKWKCRLISDILCEKNYIASSLLISPDSDVYNYLGDSIVNLEKHVFFEYDAAILAKMLYRGEQLYSKRQGEHTCVIIDDFVTSVEAKERPFKDVMMMGRHYGITSIVMVERNLMLPFSLMAQYFDYIFVCKDQFPYMLKSLFSNYGGLDFCGARGVTEFTDMVSGMDGECIVIDHVKRGLFCYSVSTLSRWNPNGGAGVACGSSVKIPDVNDENAVFTVEL